MNNKLLRRAAALILALCLLASCALADTVKVTATASVTQPADCAYVHIGASTMDASVQNASNTNALLLNGVIAAVTAKGIPLSDITTQDYSISPVYDYRYDESGHGSSLLIGYTVQNMLRITVKDLSLVNTVIDAATGAGANECYGLSYAASDTAAAADQALTAAIEEGKRRAAIAAAAMGREIDTVTEVCEISNVSAVYAKDISLRSAKEEASAETPLMPGEQSCSVTVEVTCSLK